MVARSPKTQNAVWDRLRGSLHTLKNNSNILPQLSSAVGILLTCLDDFEGAAQHRQEFENLAAELTELSNTLNQYVRGPLSMLIPGSVKSIAISIEKQIEEVREKLSRMKKGGARNTRDDEEILRYYRRIQTLFRQLQTNVNSTAWSLANVHLVNTRLEALKPAKQAAYDSNLSVEVDRRGCTQGTRTGILSGLEDWLKDSTSWPIYWMNGIAGTGKSTIALTFCEQLEKRKLLAASFFCTRGSTDCGKAARIVPTIAYQLARYSVPYRSALSEILGQNTDIGSKIVPKQFEHLLKEPLQQVKDTMPNPLVVVIDGLDECDDRKGVELFLETLFQYAPQIPLKFLVTSRPTPEIYRKMMVPSRPREAMYLHDTDKSIVRKDIELYFKEELGSLSLSSADIEQLVERSGAFFVYATSLVRYIQSGGRSGSSYKRLLSLLNMGPDDTNARSQTDDLYRAILDSALSEDKREADERAETLAVLRAVLFSQEPLSAEEIARLAKVKDARRARLALLPLLPVLHQSKETGLVSTFHPSFADFLFNKERSGRYFCGTPEPGLSKCLAS
ncbi:hypothetical protein RSOLAG1IB_08599 [Rhizoctonia solani AG-1 IB]|uniref:NACHT domain-containing protein n=1 Tax=Thanatephorus cucumeris (strain AG1-IB / isolate 7/3/14) TaxID=1108050 RepID=A0A0B7FQM3_THACB|nr:hypothetical protein RSOLAG1IB_08599 [Rhizoctonia solani AG-1 IB]